MSKELIVSSTAHETKVAIMEDDELVEVYFEREKQYGLAGSIYKGRVTRVLPGMQSAFVNIGLDRDAFLYVSDFFEDNEEYDRIVTTVEDKVVKMQEKNSAREEGAGEANGATEAATAEAAPAEPAAASRQEETGPDRRLQGFSPGPSRRGRRGRRRRMAGRGFPESKYVTKAEAPVPGPEPEAVQATEAPEKKETPFGFEVLPGESLAKYSQPPATGEEVKETAGADLPPDAAAAQPLQETAPASAGKSGNSARPGFAPGVESEGAALPPASGALETEAEQEAAPEMPEAAPEVEAIAVEEALAEVEAVEAVAVEEPARAEEAAGQEEAAPVVAAAEADVVVAVEAGSEAPAESGPGASREASVRERPYGQRYLHRGSRRMRRRGRSDFRERRTAEQTSEPAPAAESAPQRASETSITDLLKEGQEIIVQIAKEPIGKKGARITSHIALPGRYLVYMPTVDHVGVSRKILSEEERSRLKKIVLTNRVGMPGGFIVRTAGEGQPEEEIRSDMHFLYNLWLDIRQKAERKTAPALIHQDLGLVERLLRDQLTETFKTIWVDSQEDYERILSFVERFQPSLVNRVKLYTRSNPIFDEFGITPEIEKALRPKVWLKSGGYIVINQTEALVAIDVNTGKYVGKSNRLEDTIVKTNMDAVKEIVRQIRLRDLGGIIVVDFIDMDERKNRQKVMQTLDEALRADRSPSKILQFNDFGLVAITRKRVKQSLERTLCSPCPYCDASGYVKSVTTVIQEILVEAKKIAGSLNGRDVTLRVNPEVAKVLKSRDNTYLEEIEGILRRPVLVKSDPLLHQERFDFN
jgi:Rne/Rng family ribonuclease